MFLSFALGKEFNHFVECNAKSVNQKREMHVSFSDIIK